MASSMKRPLDSTQPNTAREWDDWIKWAQRERARAVLQEQEKAASVMDDSPESPPPETTPTDDAGFERPAKVSKKTATLHRPTTAIKNSFSVLTPETDLDNDEDNDLSTDDDKDTTHARTSNKAEPGKIAPIIIRDGQAWKRLGQKLNDKKIRFNKAKMVQSGIQIEPQTETDYRDLYTLLKNDNVPFYTYQLKSEKTIKAVLRGVILEITPEEVKQELEEKGQYTVLKVSRMNGRNGPAPLVLVEVDRQYKSIFNLRTICNLSITVEPLKKSRGIVQCHRCQLFGHVQRNCNSEYRCMKCGDSHSTHLCKKSPALQPTCANCGGEHLSTSLRCEKNPNKPRQPTLPTMTPTTNVWTERLRQQQQNKQQTKQTPEKPKPTQKQTDNLEELHLLLGKMLHTFSQTNPTTDQLLSFTKNTQSLISLYQKNSNE